MNPLISKDKISRKGNGLQRPECVLATRSGNIYTADWQGGVAQISHSGEAYLWHGDKIAGTTPRPNGIALCADGSFIFAELGETNGGVYRLDRSGQITALLDTIDGVPLPPCNFLLLEKSGRIWLSVSTRQIPRASAYSGAISDGFIIVIDGHGAKIAADGLGYTNEMQISPDGNWLYVNETFSRRLSRFRLGSDGLLAKRETVAIFGSGVFPDGVCFDSEGAIWITSIVSNRIIRVLPSGEQQPIIEDADEEHINWVEAAFESNSMSRQHLDKSAGQLLKNISSVAFGGKDLKTVYVGCLLDDCVYTFRSPVAGLAPVHWEYG
ncbi:SMP-30/gluconolactonase/LRE family protein [Pantoea sp. App145]|uniref:SMP-30/gluconolactonase/LRE family protein n=1 Tax=Pantoea sp. App145 TaxID=3071567 RepID=UPI003A806622